MGDKSDRPGSRGAALRPYQKPTLIKGPVLTNVAATPPAISKRAICWIARAAFGEDDIRWMIFREWLLDDAPAWFRWFYVRHGELMGSWLSGRPAVCRVVRALMMPAVKRKFARI
jgi:hypothetical protein